MLAVKTPSDALNPHFLFDVFQKGIGGQTDAEGMLSRYRSGVGLYQIAALGTSFRLAPANATSGAEVELCSIVPPCDARTTRLSQSTDLVRRQARTKSFLSHSHEHLPGGGWRDARFEGRHLRFGLGEIWWFSLQLRILMPICEFVGMCECRAHL